MPQQRRYTLSIPCRLLAARRRTLIYNGYSLPGFPPCGGSFILLSPKRVPDHIHKRPYLHQTGPGLFRQRPSDSISYHARFHLHLWQPAGLPFAGPWKRAANIQCEIDEASRRRQAVAKRFSSASVATRRVVIGQSQLSQNYFLIPFNNLPALILIRRTPVVLSWSRRADL